MLRGHALCCLCLLGHPPCPGLAADAETAADGGCPAGWAATGQCAEGGGELPQNASGGAHAFWEDIRRRGLRVKLEERSAGGQASTVLSADVSYRRPILRVPTRALLGPATVTDAELRRDLADRLPKIAQDAVETGGGGLAAGDLAHSLGLAYSLVAERRKGRQSVFSEWIEAVKAEGPPFVLELTGRHLKALAGTTVEGVRGALEQEMDLLERHSADLAAFSGQAVTRAEAGWALGVIERHAHPVLSKQWVASAPQGERPRLAPVVELLRTRWHPDHAVAGLAEEVTGALPAQDEAEEFLVEVARRDMRRGAEVFSWAGRLSNSELAVRRGAGLPRSPTGVGGNVSLPKIWSSNPNTPHNREYRKFNCSHPKAFELRVTPRGWPMRNFVRCHRVAHLLANGAYRPELVEQIALLDKWPPPKQYKVDDWLTWTQADGAINRVILEYCTTMKRRLKESISLATAEDFRSSDDPTDLLLWRLRGEESKAFRECVSLAKSLNMAGSAAPLL